MWKVKSIMLSTTKLIVVSGGLALSLTAGAGIASAEPDVSPIINSTCTYPQVLAALNAQESGLAQQLSETPAATGFLQALISASPEQRRTMVAQAQTIPGVQQYTPVILAVAKTCNNF
jgi:hemophore-related protein